MTDAELEAVRGRAAKAAPRVIEGATICGVEVPWPEDVRASADDVPALLAEVDRLRAELARSRGA